MAKLQKYGKTKSGKTRWRCPVCRTTRTLPRNDVRQIYIDKAIRRYLVSRETLSSLARRIGCSERTASRRLKEYFKRPLEYPVETGEITDYIIMDATWLENGVAVAIILTPDGVRTWRFGKREGLPLWQATLEEIPRPRAIVCDGQKGMLEAIRRVYGEDIPIQRCQFHIMQNMRQNIPAGNRHPAVTELRKLSYKIKYVKTDKDKASFAKSYYELYERYKDYINAENLSKPRSHAAYPVYVNKRLNVAYGTIRTVLEDDQLFTCINHPELCLPNTTNMVEGGINARLQELLRSHRGLSLRGQMHLTSEFLWTKTPYGEHISPNITRHEDWLL